MIEPERDKVDADFDAQTHSLAIGKAETRETLESRVTSIEAKPGPELRLQGSWANGYFFMERVEANNSKSGVAYDIQVNTVSKNDADIEMRSFANFLVATDGRVVASSGTISQLVSDGADTFRGVPFEQKLICLISS